MRTASAYAYDVGTNKTRVAVMFLDFSGHRVSLKSVIHDPRSMGTQLVRPCLAGGGVIRVLDPKPLFYFAESKVSEHNLHHLLGLLVPRGALGDLERGQCPLVRPGCLPESSQRCLLPTDCQVS